MKMDVVLTRKELEGAVLAALNVYGKAKIDSLYLRVDGGIECTVRTIEEPVHSSRNSTDSCTAATGHMQLWTPDPPPFIHSVEPTAEQVAEQVAQRRPLEGWWPPLAAGETMSYSRRCACGHFHVTEEHGWVHNGTLHALHGCEKAQVEERPWKEIEADWWPPLPQAGKDMARLVATECACKKFGVYPEHGWVSYGNLHRPERCEGVEVEAAPPAISDAAALSASSTSEHGTVEGRGEDKIPF